LFEQFKENLRLAKEFGETARAGLRSAQESWRQANATKRAFWLLVPATIVITAVSDHFSVPWYYDAAVLVLAVLASWMRAAIRRQFQ
jgi:hypothetical protein